MKILLLEDDMLLSEIITEQLEYYGYQVSPVYTGIEAETLFYKESFDLLLLDVNVPELSGFAFLNGLRQLGKKTPAIFITSLNTPNDVLKGFEIGANDYLKKPFDMLELVARIENLKRHFHIGETKCYTLNETTQYDTTTHKLIIKDQEHLLSNKEASILEYLIHRRGDVINANELGINLWSYEDQPTSATIRSYIKSLRKLLWSEAIETIRGVGYRFN